MMRKFYLATSLALMAGVCFAADGVGSGAADGSTNTQKVKDALSRLDVANDEDWTNGGLPEVARMQELTGIADLKRQDISTAVPGFNRSNAGAAPSDLSNAGSGSGGDAGPSGGPVAGEEGELTAKDLTQPNLDPDSNPNVGKTDLGPYEGQAHTADQGERLDAEELAEDGDEVIELLEKVVSLAQGDRYRRNGELQNLVRHYQVNQIQIKSLQKRLDDRDRAREEARSTTE